MKQVNIMPSFEGILGKVLTGQHGRDGQDFVGAVELCRSDKHLGELRIERKLGHDGAKFRHVAIVIQGAQVVEELQRPHQSLGSYRINQYKT